jgi:hypothetical protein
MFTFVFGMIIGIVIGCAFYDVLKPLLVIIWEKIKEKLWRKK